MHCTDLKDRMSAYLERDLPPGERRDFEAHLDACAPCRQEIGGMRRTLRTLADLPPAPGVPPAFEAELARRIARTGAGLPSRLQRGLGVAAALVLAFGAGSIVGLRRADRSGAPIAAGSGATASPALVLSPDVRRGIDEQGWALLTSEQPGGASDTLVLVDPRLMELHPRSAGPGSRTAAIPPQFAEASPVFAGLDPDEIYIGGNEATELYMRTRPASAAAGPSPTGLSDMSSEVEVLPAVVKQSF